jgi:hypothetical protein
MAKKPAKKKALNKTSMKKTKGGYQAAYGNFQGGVVVASGDVHGDAVKGTLTSRG